MHDAGEARVGFGGSEFEFGDQAVEFVEDEAGGEALDPALAEDGVGLDVDALDGVHQEESAVAEAGGGGDLAAEVDVAGGVDEVHGVALVPEEDGGALHGDGAPLLLVQVVHEADATGQLRVDDAAARRGDEVVGEGGLAVVDVR